MPNWKKVVVSGSDAILNSVTATDYGGNISGSSTSTGSFGQAIGIDKVIGKDVAAYSNYGGAGFETRLFDNQLLFGYNGDVDAYGVMAMGSTSIDFKTSTGAYPLLRLDKNTGDIIVWNGNVSASGDFLGSATSTGSFGRVQSSTLQGTIVTPSQTNITSVGTIGTGTWQSTDVGLAYGGTGASTAAAARTNLGIAIGSDVQAYDAGLAYLAGLTITNESTFKEQTGLEIGVDVQAYNANNATTSTNWSAADITSGTLAVARGGTALTSLSTLLNSNVTPSSLSLVIGTNVQAYDAQLDSIAGWTAAQVTTIGNIGTITTAADKMIYTTAADTFAETALTSFGRSILDDANEATFKTTVNLEIGTDVQAYDAQLADLAGLAVTDSSFIVGDGSNFVLENASTSRTSLGLGTSAVLSTAAISDGGSGVATADQIHTFVTTQTDATDADTSGKATTAGTADLATTVTITDKSDSVNYDILFGNSTSAVYDDADAFTYNPGTATLVVPNINISGTQTFVDTATLVVTSSIIFEGATSDGYETTLTVVDPTEDQTWTLPNATDTVVGKATTDTLTNKTLTSPTITGTGAIAGTFTGNVTGNADTSTKISSITNSNIVQLTSSQTLTNKTLTSPDINTPDIDGGNIDGATIATSDITVGNGKTLNVSAGTLTLAANQISGDKVEGGTIAATTITALTTAGITATSNIDIGTYTLTGTRFISDIATGTAPFGVTSTTVVSNLNADLLDGQQGSYYTDFTNITVTSGEVSNAMLANSSINFGGISLSLGGSDTTPAFALADATGLPIVAGTTGTLSVARGGTGVTTSTGTGNTVLSASPTFTGTINAAAGTFSGNVSGSATSTGSFAQLRLNVSSLSNSGSEVVTVDGTQGRLFSITDEMSGSIFSANTIAGLPVIEAFSDNTVTLGPFSSPMKIDSSGNISASADIVAEGDVVAYYTSDIRLKDNIEVIKGSLDKIDGIRGVEFDWNEKAPGWARERGHDVGVIAQEVEKVLPEVVQKRKNGYLGVDYKRIIPLLIESVKELKQEIEDLKKKVI